MAHQIDGTPQAVAEWPAAMIVNADWPTRTGRRGLADADWPTRTGRRGLARRAAYSAACTSASMSCSASQRSASSAAMQPMPADVTACRYL
jgi:hypothetical protein